MFDTLLGLSFCNVPYVVIHKITFPMILTHFQVCLFASYMVMCIFSLCNFACFACITILFLVLHILLFHINFEPNIFHFH
jgi:hypothetical protein